MEKIKILICDDMMYICKCFEILLSKEADMEVVGKATNQEGCMELIHRCQPDIVLLDIQMSFETEGLVILEEIKKQYPEMKVIMLTIHEDDEVIFRALSSGANDYLLKSSEEEFMVESIRRVYRGDVSLNPYIARKILSECQKAKKIQSETIQLVNAVAQLTSAEYKILRLLYAGYSYAEIAQQRFVEKVTIRTQIHKILKKFEVKSVKQLIGYLKEIKVFDLEQ